MTDITLDFVGGSERIALAAAHRATSAAAAVGEDATQVAADALAVAAYLILAGAYRDATLEAVEDLDAEATLPLQAVSLAALQDFAIPAAGRQAYLSEAGRKGPFSFRADNQAAAVAADPLKGRVVRPDADPTGASGAWFRDDDGTVIDAGHYGFSPANGATNHLRLQAAINAAPSGGAVIVPAGVMPNFGQGLTSGSAIVIDKPLHLIFAAGHKTELQVAHGEQVHTVNIRASGVVIEDIHISGQRCSSNADGRFPIEISSRHNTGATAGADIRNVTLIRPKLRDCDMGIRAVRSVWAGPTFFVPTGIKVIDPDISDCRYQALVPWADNVEVFGGRIHMKGGIPVRPFHAGVRLIGSNGFRAWGTRFVDDLGIAMVKAMTGGVDSSGNLYGAQYNDARRARFEACEFEGLGYMVNIYDGPADAVKFVGCDYFRDMSRTDEVCAIVIGQNNMNDRFGVASFERCNFFGFTAVLVDYGTNCRALHLDKVKVYKNGFTGTPTAFPWAIDVTNGATGLLDGAGGQIVGITDLDVDNCGFFLRDGAYPFFARVADSKAGTRFRLRGSDLPHGTTTQMAGTNNAGSVTATGNTVLAAGFVAQLVAGVKANPRSTQYA